MKHRVFVSVFLSQEAVTEIRSAYDQTAAPDEKLDFICVYFGSQQTEVYDKGTDSL